MDATLILPFATMLTGSSTIALAVLLRQAQRRLQDAEGRAQAVQQRLDEEQQRHLEERRLSQDQLREANNERERRYHAGIEEGRKATTAELQPKLAALERQLADEQRLRLEQRRELQDRISQLQTEAERRYHAGIEEGIRRERQNYTVIVTPFVRRHEGWLSSSCTYGYRLRFQVHGLPTTWDHEEVVAAEQKIEVERAAKLATQAASVMLRCAVAHLVGPEITTA